MDQLELLNTLLNERLAIAAKEIYGISARIIWEVDQQYKADVSRLQKENERQQKLLDAMLKPDVRLKKSEFLHLPVHNEEGVCPEKKQGNRCLDQEELPQNCRRLEDLAEANSSKVTSVLMESNVEENTPPIQRDIHSDEEDCEIPRDTGTSVKADTSPVRVLKSCLEPLKDTGTSVEVHSDGEACEKPEPTDDDLSTRRSSSKIREHPSGRNSQKRKVTRKVKEHRSPLKSCEEPPKDTGSSVKVHSDGKDFEKPEPTDDDGHLSTRRSSSKIREHLSGRNSQERKVTRKVKEHRLTLKKKLKSCEEPPKYTSTSVKGQRSNVKKSKISRKSRQKHKSSIIKFSSPLSCKVCKKAFNDEEALINHVDVHLNDCGLCGHHLEYAESLIVHLEAHRTCNVCGKIFTTIITLAEHMRDQHTYGKALTCTICCKVFRKEMLLKSHMRTHSTEKPYSCTVCDKSFRHSSTLDKHMLLHTGEKPFSCKFCGIRFRQKDHVTQHISVHTGDRPYKCSICDKSFRLNATMKKHMTMHTALKAYECLVCGKKLSREDSMRRHRKLHERPGRKLHEKTGKLPLVR